MQGDGAADGVSQFLANLRQISVADDKIIKDSDLYKKNSGIKGTFMRLQRSFAKDNPFGSEYERVSLFSKNGYQVFFGEPVSEGSLWLTKTTLAKLNAAANWHIIHPYSIFRRYWDVFLMFLLLYVALMVWLLLRGNTGSCDWSTTV